MKVHIFNPENDLALADGKPGYTAPASARQMRENLSWLPKWWAAEEDIVWDGETPLKLSPGDEICPWGWSPAIIHQLKNAGVTDEFLPTPQQMEHLRQLSHRQTAVEALAAMREQGVAKDCLVGNSALCHSMDEILAEVKRWPQALLKAPWSSSGKGLMMSNAANYEAWAANILQQQGSVVVEEWKQKLCDFALLFWLDGKGGVEYRGLSLFYTNNAGAYVGNWLAHEGQKLQWLMQYCPPQILVEIRQWWTEYLTRFDYQGPVGIDMMLCQDGVCPCVEINWRMTMGMVAQLLTQQGHTGKLLVQYIYGQYCAEVEAFE